MRSRGKEPPDDAKSIFAWRVERLRNAGFPVRLAADIARDARYDVHALLELTDRGCPADLAAQILCPLDHCSERSQ